MNNTQSLANWIEVNTHQIVPGAEQFYIGQALTSDEAGCVRRMLNRAFLDSVGLNIISEHFTMGFPTHVPFLQLFLRLVDAGHEEHWKSSLYNVLTPDECELIKRGLENVKTYSEYMSVYTKPRIPRRKA